MERGYRTEGLEEALIDVYKYLKGGYKEDEARG